VEPSGAAAVVLGSVEVLAGRVPLGWGPSLLGGFGFSEFAGGFDRLQLSFTPWHWLQFTKHVGWLDAGRSIIATRADFEVFPNLRIGVAESVLMLGAPYWLYFVNPIPMSVGFEINVARLRDFKDDNYLAVFDAEWVPHPGWRLFGEFLADDLIAAFPWFHGPDAFPSRVALMAGVEVLDVLPGWDLLAQYTIVPNWVYSTFAAHGHYLLRGLPLGHPLGSDFDTLHVRMTRREHPERTFALWASYVRKGEGRVGRMWRDREEANRLLFLSGTVEHSILLGGEYSWTDADWQYSVGPWIAYRMNAGHVTGLTRLDWGLSLSASVRF
jgi:hypothetical protein